MKTENENIKLEINSINNKKQNIKPKINSYLSEKVKNYNEFILSKNSKQKITENELKVYIIENKVLPHICKLCKMTPIWNKKPLDFVLDRINNNVNDNNIENLRFLCPNCFSQIKRKSSIFSDEMRQKNVKCVNCGKTMKFKTNIHKTAKCFTEICNYCKNQEKLINMLSKANNYPKEI